MCFCFDFNEDGYQFQIKKGIYVTSFSSVSCCRISEIALKFKKIKISSQDIKIFACWSTKTLRFSVIEPQPLMMGLPGGRAVATWKNLPGPFYLGNIAAKSSF